MDEVSEILTAFGAVLAVSLAEESDLLISLLFNGLDFLGLLLGVLAHRRQHVRIAGFAEDVVPRYHPEDFRQHFRVSRRTASILVTALGHCRGIPRASDPQRRGILPVDVEKQLLVTLWFLATQEPFRSIGDRFGICNATAYRIVKRVISVINRNWTPKIIRWPKDSASARYVIDGFQGRRGLQGVLGAIDGSHIAIKAPRSNQDAYINRKCFHSIVLQAVCDHRMFFRDCFAGYPGSTHDARVLKNSDLYDRITESVDTLFLFGSYLLGDSAYPLSSWLMTPYKDNGHLSEKQRNYNFLHSSTRMAIERAFALLKGRFRRLKYVDIDRLEDVPDIILATCTLHNICIMSENDIEHFVDSDDDNQEADGIDGLDEDGVEENNSIGNADGSRINIGKRKRDLIAEQLWEHCRVLT